jgi:hypothetical protein
MSHAIHVRKTIEEGKHIVSISIQPPVPGIADDRWEYDTAERASQALASALKFAEHLKEQGTIESIELHRVES